MSYDYVLVPKSEQKPYRVYRQPRRARGAADGTIQWDTLEQQHGGGRKRPGLPRHLMRFLRRAVFVAFVLAVIWSIVAFVSFRSAVKESNDRLPADVRAVLAPTNGPALTSSQVTLLVGAGTSAYRKKTTGDKTGLADSIILMRVDVPSRSVSMLSIPRDMYVPIRGFSESKKINRAYAEGGLKLAIETVHAFTGVDINHVIEINFDGFREIVDAVGGVTINNPSYLSSSQKFDGQDWVFRKGTITLNGRNALAYARMRHTDQLDQADDRQRALRQQRVLDALTSKIASFESVKHPRDVPRSVVAPIKTDMGASELMATGFGKFWSKGENNLHCRLGGTGERREIDGLRQDVIVPDEENRAVVRMFLGTQAPVKPDGPVAAGCLKQ